MLLPYSWSKTQRLILREDNHQLQALHCTDTPDWALAEVRRRYRQADFKLVPAQEIEQWLNSSYGQQDNAAAVMDAASNEIDLDSLMHEMPEVEDLLESSDDAPIIRMINALLTQAANQGASDIHIEPFENRSVVRFRIDGTLRDIVQPKRALHNALISRIKIMAKLDIAEKRLPQDGRISLRVGGRAIDVRVSTLPTGHGERAVLRLLDKSAGRLELAALGLAPSHYQQLTSLIRRPHGIVLVTGPTGSGKTTTLYAAIGCLDAQTTNILTVEDPIEYDLAGVSQTQVNSRIDLHFSTALRAILRQDPDVIMIGEIRDLETAQIAVQASLTGHLVLATLHTNDAVSAVTRLIDMGIEPFLLASTLQGALAQRLIRKLCEHCKTPIDSGRAQRNPQGCEHCGFTGYRGRTGIHELFVVDDNLRSLISQNADTHTLRQHAQEHGMHDLHHDGLRWLDSGQTSEEELQRVTREH
ncbi:type II secretion system protein GspE [Alcaligenaceae bacterium 429]|nr:type II secretion system protein GspE [Alcaligenaceae bacterium 429]